VLEASGGYEKAAWLALWSAGIKVARINPRDAYHFAQASRQLAKTDRLDAQGLRRFGAQLKPDFNCNSFGDTDRPPAFRGPALPHSGNLRKHAWADRAHRSRRLGSAPRCWFTVWFPHFSRSR
jgi:hypothetical protein